MCIRDSSPSYRLHWHDVDEIVVDPLSQKILFKQEDQKRKRRLMPALWFAVEHDLQLPEYKRMPRFKRKPMEDYPLYQVIQACKPDDLEMTTLDHSNNPMATDLGDAARNFAVAAVLCVFLGLLLLFFVDAVVVANGYYWLGFAGVVSVAFVVAVLLMHRALADAKKRLGVLMTGALFAVCLGYFCNTLVQLNARYFGVLENHSFELVGKLGEYSRWREVNQRWPAIEMSSEYFEDAEVELNTVVEVPIRVGAFGIYQLQAHDFKQALKRNQQPDK